MKLRSIAINELKKFDTPVQITGLDDQLNVIAGPNEMGKSTILSALRAAFFSRYGSKKHDILKLQNSRNKGAPSVRVVFEVEGESYQISKRFVKRPSAELRCPDGRVLRDDAAEEELHRILSFGDMEQSSGHSNEMWNLFWVEQGKSHAPIDVSEGARSGLHSVLESQVGTVLGGKRGRELLKVFKTQIEKYLTPTGRERGELAELRVKVRELSGEIYELQERREDLRECLEEFERCSQKLRRLDLENTEESERKELEQLRKKAEELRQYQLKIEIAESELKRTRGKLLAFENDRQVLIDLNKELVQVQSEKRSLNDRLKYSRDKESTLFERRDQNQKIIDQINSQIESASKELERSRQILALAEEYSKNYDREQRIQHAQVAEQRRQDCLMAANAILVTDDLLTRIQNAKSNLDIATATVKANATRVSFRPESGNCEDITVNGEVLKNEANEISVIVETDFGISNWGTITVDPAVQDADQVLKSRQAAQIEFDSVLAQVNVEDLNEAKKQNDKRKSLMLESESAKLEVGVHLPEIDQFEGGIDAFRDEVAQKRNQLTAYCKTLGLNEIPSLFEAREFVQSSESVEKKLRSKFDLPTDTVNQINIRLASIQSDIENVEQRIGVLEAKSSDIKAKIELRSKAMSEIEIEKQLKFLGEDVADQSSKLEQLKTVHTESDLEKIKLRIEQLENMLSNRHKKRQILKEQRERSMGRIETLEGAGIDEVIGQKERELQQSRDELDQISNETEVLKLLIDTLETAENEAKEMFLEPIKSRINPYLNMLFPSAELNIDEDLNIEAIDRNFSESFQNLSMGTQEQIAVLVRLTFAEMLADRGQPATVILDDALVFSDEERLQIMFEILFAASRKIQIIILTCRESLFESLGGNVLLLEEVGTKEFHSE